MRVKSLRFLALLVAFLSLLPACPAAIGAFGKLVDHGPWIGAVTATSSVVKVRVAAEGMSVRLSVGESGGARAVSFTDRQLATSSRIVAFPLRNLKPSTHYLFNVEVNGRFDRSTLGQ